MELKDFIVYLHDGAYTVYEQLIGHLSNADLKSLRLSIRPLSADLFPRLFRRIYISTHTDDLEVFVRIAKHQRAAKYVREIIWDDTTFDRRLLDIEEYRSRLEDVKPRSKQADLGRAHEFWSQCCSGSNANKKTQQDHVALQRHIRSFHNLESVTVMSRSRLTYVDSDMYRKIWQTPRSRKWRALAFYGSLLDPEPHKARPGEQTVLETEGFQTFQFLGHWSDQEYLRIVALNVELLGSGQSRIMGGQAATRWWERKWVIDLNELMENERRVVTKPQVELRLLLELQTQNLWQSDGHWEPTIFNFMWRTRSSLQEITFSSMCLDWFWHAIQTHVPTMSRLNVSDDRNELIQCQYLRKFTFRNCWCSDPLALLTWLRNSTSVCQIELVALDMEGLSWPQLLLEMKSAGLQFDEFEVTRCRSPGLGVGFGGSQTWEAPYSGSSEDITAWLRGESSMPPLQQRSTSDQVVGDRNKWGGERQ